MMEFKIKHTDPFSKYCQTKTYCFIIVMEVGKSKSLTTLPKYGSGEKSEASKHNSHDKYTKYSKEDTYEQKGTYVVK